MYKKFQVVSNFKNLYFDQFYVIIVQIFLISLIAFINNRTFFIISEIVFIVFSVARFISHRYKFTFYTLWSILILIVILISIFIAEYQMISFNTSAGVIQTIILYNLLIPFMLESRKNYLKIINSIIFSAFILIFRLIILTPISFWGTFQQPGMVIGYNPNTIGLILSITSVISFNYFRSEKKYLYIILGLVLGLSSFFSGSRKAFAVVIIGFILINILYSRNVKNFIISIIISILSIILIYSFVMNVDLLYDSIGRRIEALISYFFGGSNVDSSTITRFDMIKVGLKLFSEKPILGYGLANYSNISKFEVYSHNNYIELLVSIGLFGTSLYYMLHLKILFKAIKNRANIFLLDPICSITLISIILVTDFGMVSYFDEFIQLAIAISFVGVQLDKSHSRGNFF